MCKYLCRWELREQRRPFLVLFGSGSWRSREQWSVVRDGPVHGHGYRLADFSPNLCARRGSEGTLY